METDPRPDVSPEPAPAQEEAPPPFQPDPEIVTVLERGANPGEELRLREAVRRLGGREEHG